MERRHILGMVCGYYLSRFDSQAYARLGFETKRATHEALGRALNVPADSIKNWRDEFDPVHDNPRQGWHKREMHPSRRRTLEIFGSLTENEIFNLVKEITALPVGDAADKLVASVSESDTSGEEDSGTYSLRGPTGIRAENAFIAFYNEHQKPFPGSLVDRRYDQCGFDFEIVAGSPRVAIEVKGLTGESGGVTFTDKEWRIAREMGEFYYLALVRHVATDPDVSLLRNPRAILDAKMRTYTIVQVGWSISHRTICNAEDKMKS